MKLLSILILITLSGCAAIGTVLKGAGSGLSGAAHSSARQDRTCVTNYVEGLAVTNCN